MISIGMVQTRSSKAPYTVGRVEVDLLDEPQYRMMAKRLKVDEYPEKHGFYVVFVGAYKMLKLGKSTNLKQRLNSYIRMYDGDVYLVYLRMFESRKTHQVVEEGDWYLNRFEREVIREVNARGIQKTEPIASSEYVVLRNRKELRVAIEAVAGKLVEKDELKVRERSKREVVVVSDSGTDSDIEDIIPVLRRNYQALERPQYKREYRTVSKRTAQYRER